MGTKGEVTLCHICPPGYSLQHQARPEGRWGDVVIAFKNSIRISWIATMTCPGLTCLHLSVDHGERLGLHWCTILPTAGYVCQDFASAALLWSLKLILLSDSTIHAVWLYEFYDIHGWGYTKRWVVPHILHGILWTYFWTAMARKIWKWLDFLCLPFHGQKASPPDIFDSVGATSHVEKSIIQSGSISTCDAWWHWQGQRGDSWMGHPVCEFLLA